MKKLLTAVAALAITSNVAAIEVTAEQVVAAHEEVADYYELCLGEFMSAEGPFVAHTIKSDSCVAGINKMRRINAMNAMLELDERELEYTDEQRARLDAAMVRTLRAFTGIKAFAPNDPLED